MDAARVSDRSIDPSGSGFRGQVARPEGGALTVVGTRPVPWPHEGGGDGTRGVPIMLCRGPGRAAGFTPAVSDRPATAGVNPAARQADTEDFDKACLLATP